MLVKAKDLDNYRGYMFNRSLANGCKGYHIIISSENRKEMGVMSAFLNSKTGKGKIFPKNFGLEVEIDIEPYRDGVQMCTHHHQESIWD